MSKAVAMLFNGQVHSANKGKGGGLNKLAFLRQSSSHSNVISTMLHHSAALWGREPLIGGRELYRPFNVSCTGLCSFVVCPTGQADCLHSGLSGRGVRRILRQARGLGKHRLLLGCTQVQWSSESAHYSLTMLYAS